MKTAEQIYLERCQGVGDTHHLDINELLPTNREYGAKVKHITEFGVRSGNSTIAWLLGLQDGGGGVYRGYDIEPIRFEPEWPREFAGVEWKYIQGNTAWLTDIEPTELLFIDSCHNYEHVMAEFRFAPRVSKYIVMHDTSEEWINIGGIGPNYARRDFLAAHGDQWKMILNLQNCNGLTVLERIK